MQPDSELGRVGYMSSYSVSISFGSKLYEIISELKKPGPVNKQFLLKKLSELENLFDNFRDQQSLEFQRSLNPEVDYTK